MRSLELKDSPQVLFFLEAYNNYSLPNPTIIILYFRDIESGEIYWRLFWVSFTLKGKSKDLTC